MTAYLDQLAHQRDEAQQLLHNAEAELAGLRPIRRELHDAEQARDGAYRERAHLTAWLATLHPAVITPAPDVDEPGWQILYLHAGGRQLSWHIHPRDAELYAQVEQVPADDPRAQWDGHTTDEKYEAIRQLCATAAVAEEPPHESRIWETWDGWHVSCTAVGCPAQVDNIGGEDDAEQWAAEHLAQESTPATACTCEPFTECACSPAPAAVVQP
jgi:hypothetical protein